MSPQSQNLRNLVDSENTVVDTAERQIKKGIITDIPKRKAQIINALRTDKAGHNAKFIDCFDRLKRSFENLTVDLSEEDRQKLDSKRGEILDKVNKLVVQAIHNADTILRNAANVDNAVRLKLDRIAIASTYKDEPSVLWGELHLLFISHFGSDENRVRALFTPPLPPTYNILDAATWEDIFTKTSGGVAFKAGLDANLSKRKAEADAEVKKIDDLKTSVEKNIKDIANLATPVVDGTQLRNKLIMNSTIGGLPTALETALTNLYNALGANSDKNTINLARALGLKVLYTNNFALNQTDTSQAILAALKTRLAGISSEIQNATKARVDLFSDIQIAATTLTKIQGISEKELEQKVEELFQKIKNSHGFPAIVAALYLDPKSRYDDVTRDIRNKLEALISPVRFTKHPDQLLSDEEKADVIDNMDACDAILEELGITDHSGMTTLYNVIVNPPSHPALYLRFKEISAKHKQTGEIQMLYYINFVGQLEKQGYTFNLLDIRKKGFSPNGLLKEFVVSADPAEAHWDRFHNHLKTYRRLSERLNDHFEYLTSLKEKTPEQTEEFELLKKFDGKKSKLNVVLREVCEGYQGELKGDAKVLLRILEKYFNTVKGSASSQPFAGRGASALEEVLAQSYKSILAFGTVDINRITTQGNLAAEKTSLYKARGDYAKRRRNMAKFGWWRRSSEEQMEDSRDEYLKQSRNYITETIRHQYGDINQGTDAEKKEKSTDMRNRILELLNKERRGLFEKEINVHHNSLWTRFRTSWRRHKGLRMLGAVALAGLAIANPTVPVIGAILGARAVYSALGTEVAIEDTWEAIRNRFGKTKKQKRKNIKNMDFGTVQSLLAAQSTLAISEKHKINPKNKNVDVDVRNRLPVTDEGFNKKENPAVNEIYGYNASGWPPVVRRLPNAVANYRQNTSRELWNKYNEMMRGVIDEGIAAGETIDKIMDRVFAKEKDLMLAIENRENEIRRNNMYKKITAVVGAALVGGLVYGINWHIGHPQPSQPLSPSYQPLHSSSGFTIPNQVSPPNIGSANLAIDSGLISDNTPKIWQSIAEKLGTHGTRLFDHDPGIIGGILADNPSLGGDINTIVHAGDKINISNGTAKLIANKLGSGWDAAKVLKALAKP